MKIMKFHRRIEWNPGSTRGSAPGNAPGPCGAGAAVPAAAIAQNLKISGFSRFRTLLGGALLGAFSIRSLAKERLRVFDL